MSVVIVSIIHSILVGIEDKHLVCFALSVEARHRGQGHKVIFLGIRVMTLDSLGSRRITQTSNVRMEGDLSAFISMDLISTVRA